MSWYIFGQGKNISYIHSSSLLNEKDKENYTLIIEELPEQITPENHYARLVLINNQPMWEYEEIIK